MKTKRIIVAGAVTAGIAAIAFGGSAVSTAFSSTSADHNVNLSTGNANVTVTGDFTASNIVPLNSGICSAQGDFTPVGTVTVKNSGSTSAAATLSFATPTYNGPTDEASLEQAHVLATIDGTTLAPVNAYQIAGLLAGTTSPVSLGTWAKDQSHNVSLGICLDSTAGNNWQNASFADTFNVSMTAVHS